MTSVKPLGGVGSPALHHMPTVITKPKMIMSQPAQVLLNGPGLAAPVTNGTHAESKKEVTSSTSGRAVCYHQAWRPSCYLHSPLWWCLTGSFMDRGYYKALVSHTCPFTFLAELHYKYYTFVLVCYLTGAYVRELQEHLFCKLPFVVF